MISVKWLVNGSFDVFWLIPVIKKWQRKQNLSSRWWVIDANQNLSCRGSILQWQLKQYLKKQLFNGIMNKWPVEYGDMVPNIKVNPRNLTL